MPSNMPRNILSPKSIAVIGASEDPSKIGAQILVNIIAGGYKGKVFPINPHSESIQGLKTYKSVLDVPEKIDHAIIVIPAKYIPKVVDECGKKEIKSTSIISAGFKEIGDQGLELEKQIIEIAQQYGISIIGPNCLGFINTDIKLNATFSASTARPGNVILFSQSGAFGTAILDWAQSVNIGFKYFVSIGNKAVVDENFLLKLWLKQFGDSNENVVFAGYIEDMKKGREFMEIASKLAQRHPVIILKPGKSELANKAISSHTGSIATEDKIIDAALKQSGCLRVQSIEEMFDLIQLLSRQTIPRGNRVAVVTNAGGPGVTVTDSIENSCLQMATLSDTTTYALQNKLPDAASTSNPIDVIGDAKADRYEHAIEIVMVDENVDSVLVLLTPQAITEVEKTAGIIADKYKKYPSKPVVASFIGGTTTQKGIDILNQYRMPIFDYPSDAVRALANAYKYRLILNSSPKANESNVTDPNINIMQRPHPKLHLGCNIVGKQAEEFIESYGIPVPPCITIPPNGTAPKSVSTTLGFPVVAKITSPELLHKTEFEGVKLNLHSMNELELAVQQLNHQWSKNFGHNTKYEIQIQKMITNGQNLIIGFKRNPSFGPVILFGTGGIFTELFTDTSQRIAPINKELASDMINETKISKVLKGWRKAKPYDIESIVNAITLLSKVAMENPNIAEVDINPFIVLNDTNGGYAADVKIITTA